MIHSRLLVSVLATTLACVAPLATGADVATNVLTFSDPSQPGTVKINLGRGELRVQGTDTSEVSVRSEAASTAAAKPRKDGLRVISAAASYSFKESKNVITLDTTANDVGRSHASFHLTVPRNVTLIVQNAWGGDVHCRDLSGDIEINSMQGQIRLEDVSGGIVVGTMNGEIHASIRALQEGKPLSFTSMNGEVVLRVPADAKASVRLRTQNGSVLTDFAESALVTKTEAASGFGRHRPFTSARGGKVLTMEVQEAIREATQLSATAIREALEAVREGLEAAKLDTDDARRALDAARREMERGRRESEARIAITERRQPSEEVPVPPAAPKAPAPARAPIPPKPPVATITGGKLVTGTLNGGGPEISVATMNGDVILRKLEPAP
ncbi:MAG: DUF4097 family beta strand repeat protein [Opitutaceae bacterium]|nr:DUF4097 family beta strand repeat protein [Opitutaceae bacterium]